jgi:hypothetical protein
MSCKNGLSEYLTYRAIQVRMINFPIGTCNDINPKFMTRGCHSKKQIVQGNEKANQLQKYNTKKFTLTVIVNAKRRGT